MAAGTGAELPPGTALAGAPWLAVAVADRAPGRRDARVRSGRRGRRGDRPGGRGPLHTDGAEVAWRDGDVRSARVERLGAIVLAERPLPATPDPPLVAAAVAEGLRREGLGAAALDAGGAAAAGAAGRGARRARRAVARGGRRRAARRAGRHARSGARSRADLRAARRRRRAAGAGAVAGRRRRWTTSSRSEVDVPGGSGHRVDYADPDRARRLAVRVQEVFGWAQTPVVAGRPLRLELLSPARRVVATTADLAGFWVTGYPAVRSELQGRYPRHPWPEDPAARGADPAGEAPPRVTTARSEPGMIAACTDDTVAPDIVPLLAAWSTAPATTPSSTPRCASRADQVVLGHRGRRRPQGQAAGPRVDVADLAAPAATARPGSGSTTSSTPFWADDVDGAGRPARPGRGDAGEDRGRRARHRDLRPPGRRRPGCSPWWSPRCGIEETGRGSPARRGAFRLAFGSGDYRRDTGTAADDLAMAYPRSRLVVAQPHRRAARPDRRPDRRLQPRRAARASRGHRRPSASPASSACDDRAAAGHQRGRSARPRPTSPGPRDFLADFEARGQVIRDGSDLPRTAAAPRKITVTWRRRSASHPA